LNKDFIKKYELILAEIHKSKLGGIKEDENSI